MQLQGKAPVAADQRQMSPPQSVPQSMPTATPVSAPMPTSDLESIEAALAVKTQQFQQMADKADSLDWPYWRLYQEITTLEGQVLTPPGQPLPQPPTRPYPEAPSIHSSPPIPCSGNAFTEPYLFLACNMRASTYYVVMGKYCARTF